MDGRPTQRLTVDGIVIDLADDVLRDAAGATVPLRPQAFDVLRHLVANAGRVVTKDQLMAAVWPGLAVTDDSLVQCVHEIRRALGDGAHSVLRTVPRRGYKLVLPHSPVGPSARRPRAAGLAALALGAAGAWWLDRAARRWALAFGAMLLAVGLALVGWSLARPGNADASLDGPPVVAVPPVVNVAGDAGSEGMALGFKKVFFTELARFREFQIVLRPAGYDYRNDPADGLGVDFVVGCSIHREGGQLRITAHLIDARTGNLVWSERWDRPDGDLLAVETEIAERIANRLGGNTGLILETGRSFARRKAPDDLTGYELYLLATEKLAGFTRADVEAAVALLDRSVARDPGLARAWVELSVAHDMLADFGVEPERNRRAAADAARHALELDPRDSKAHVVMGESLWHEGEHARARSEFDTALVLAPNAAETLTFYTGWAATFGEAERGANMVERVERLYPGVPLWAWERFAHAYFMAGRYAEALEVIDRLAADNYTLAVWAMRPAALAALGRHEEAAAWGAKAAAARPDLSIEALANAPDYGDAERRRLVETMRLAGFPPCADADVLARIDPPRRLAECAARAEVRAPRP